MKHPDQILYEMANRHIFIPDKPESSDLENIIVNEIMDGDKLIITLNPRYHMSEDVINQFCDYLKDKSFSVAILKNFRDRYNCVMAFNKKIPHQGVIFNRIKSEVKIFGR